MIPSIQVLRGAAAFLVVCCHIFNSGRKYVIPLALQDAWQIKYGLFGVDIFFVISGFIIFYVSRGLLDKPNPRFEFLKRRLIRIVPMYWIGTFLIALILLLHLFPQLNFDPAYFLYSLFFIPHLGADGETRAMLHVGWTLCFEMYFYFVFAFFSPLSERTIVAGTGVFFGLSALASFFLPLPRIEMISFLVATPLLLEFWFGIVLGYFYMKGSFKDRRGAAALSLAAGIALSLFLTPTSLTGTGATWRFLAWGLPAFMIVLGVLVLGPSFKGGLGRRLMRVGDASYTLYLFHHFTILATWKGCSYLFDLSTYTGSLTVILLCLVVSISVALFIYDRVESPLTRILHQKFNA